MVAIIMKLYRFRLSQAGCGLAAGWPRGCPAVIFVLFRQRCSRDFDGAGKGMRHLWVVCAVGIAREKMMGSHCGCNMLRRGAVFVCALLVFAGGLRAGAAARDDDYLHDDVKIAGKEIQCFTDGGEQISVILGGFKLTLGKRVISGQEGVIWIRQQEFGGVAGNTIIIYIEGDAKVFEPPIDPNDPESKPRTTTDKVMLVIVRHQGRVSAPSVVANPKVKESALYKRAVIQKRQSEQREIELAKTRPAKSARHAPPEFVEAKRGQAATGPASKSTTGPASRPTTTTAPAGLPVLPVYFHADKLNSKLMEGGRRMTVARGNVYLSQGNPKSDMFLELRSGLAVIISQKYSEDRPPPKKDSHSPYSPGISPTARESIVGVYLENDVVIARGERYLRGPEAFYDFTTDRAIVPNGVFRTVQGQRNLPIIIRFGEARTLSAREMFFRNAKISTSDFYTPTYHIGARDVYLMDTAPYDEKGVRLSEQRWLTIMRHSTFNIRGVPVLYTPYSRSEVEQGHTALRKARIGYDSTEGFGVMTQWHLFRVLGIVRPKDVHAYLTLDWHQRSYSVGVEYEYERQDYTGYGILYGQVDRAEEDEFGEERVTEAPESRGRVLARHKQFLRGDWQMQFELSYLCDKNFLESEFPDEFHAGKEQETLIYAKKQRDNWALTSLLQARLNRFDSQAESFPDVGFHLLGQPLLRDTLTFFSESHLGAKRWRPANDIRGDAGNDSTAFVRADTRNEVDMPLKFGPYNIVPFAMARGTYWSDEPTGGENFRPYAQVGVRANTHFWRVYENARSRFWDVNRLKHIITPEVTGFLGWAGDVQPQDLYPMDPDIETHIGGLSGMTFGIHQRLQTKRGRKLDGTPMTVDWMRLDVVAGFYDSRVRQTRSDGQFFAYRPEHSIGRDHINVDYTWNISDSTAFLADMNYDIDRAIIGRSGMALAIARDPRLKYFVGLRTIEDMDSTIGTFGFHYKLNKKYTFSFFQQYDFDFKGGTNSITSVSIVRKLPRWYAGFTVTHDRRYDDLTVMMNFWPEGIAEVMINTGRVRLLNRSDKN